MKIKNKSKKKIISLQYNNAKEYISNKIKNQAKKVKITLETIVLYMSEQNNISE